MCGVEGDTLYRNVLAVIDPKERRVVVCLHIWITDVREIRRQARVREPESRSKWLAKIRAKASKWLG
jgi:hypothetical protein